MPCCVVDTMYSLFQTLACRHTAMSCAEDGSVRIWDTEKITQKTVLKPTLARPGRSTVTACTYNSEGGMIAAGLKDGSIQIWDVRGE